MKKLILAGIAAAGIGLTHQPVSAALHVVLYNMGVPYSDTTTLTGYQGYILSVSTDTGNIFGVDMSGTHQATGVLHQIWNDPNATSSYQATPISAAINLTPSMSNLDTHLIPNPFFPGVNYGSGPSEDNSGTASPLSTTPSIKPGHGSFLSAAFAFTDPNVYTPRVDVAYFVIPDNQQGSFIIQGGLFVNVNGQTFNAGDVVAIPPPPYTPPTPEPGSGLLIGAAACALLSRRGRSRR